MPALHGRPFLAMSVILQVGLRTMKALKIILSIVFLPVMLLLCVLGLFLGPLAGIFFFSACALFALLVFAECGNSAPRQPPSPYDSGESRRSQGISKAGNSLVRHVMIQSAWAWLRHQPQSMPGTAFAMRSASLTPSPSRSLYRKSYSAR